MEPAEAEIPGSAGKPSVVSPEDRQFLGHERNMILEGWLGRQPQPIQESVIVLAIWLEIFA